MTITVFQLTPSTISTVMGIPLLNPDPFPTELTELALHMGPSVLISDRSGVDTKGMYKNVHLVCRWIQRNLIGSHHHTTTHISTLQMIYGLMHRTPPCICTFVFDTIADVQSRHCNYVLPALISKIMSRTLPPSEFRIYQVREVEYVREEHFSHRYDRSSLMWTPAEGREDVPTTHTISSSSSSSFPSFHEEDFMSTAHTEASTSCATPYRESSSSRNAFMKFGKMCKKIYKGIKCVRDDIRDLGEDKEREQDD